MQVTFRAPWHLLPGPVGTGKTMLMNLFDEESRKAPTKLTGKLDLSNEMKAKKHPMFFFQLMGSFS